MFCAKSSIGILEFEELDKTRRIITIRIKRIAEQNIDISNLCFLSDVIFPSDCIRG